MVDPDLVHVPVLTEEVLHWLAVAPGEKVLDLTVGSGGHSRKFCDGVGPDGLVVGMDVDSASLSRAEAALAGMACRVVLMQSNFRDALGAVESASLGPFDAVLADLGISSAQLDDAERGFSFRADGPLDMRLDPDLPTTATDLVNRLSERDLADLIFYNSQEMKSRRIARRICFARKSGRITTTGKLSEIVCKALGVKDPNSRRLKIHPATRTFQALRIAVNDEIGALRAMLDSAPALLATGGRLAVIAFHSVEDKVVKTSFREGKSNGIYEILTRKPVIAGEEERRSNPRARSAKLRAVRKLEGPSE